MVAVDFNKVTRQKHAPLPGQTFAYGTTLSFPIPRVGLLQGIVVTVRGTTNTLTGAANAFGYCSLIRRVRLFLNSGIDLFSVSGPGYHLIVAPHLDGTFSPFPLPTGVTSGPTSAIASGQTFAVDFYIPVAPNLRDAVALLMLQNEQTLATVNIECEAQANIAATSLTFTTTPTVTVYPRWFTLPPDAGSMPDLSMLHRTIEETQSITLTGDNVYVWPRGDVYLQMLHGTTANTAGLATAALSERFTRARVRVNQSDFIYDYDNASLDVVTALTTGQARGAGVIPFNMMASAGLGMYDQARDVIQSADYTDLASVITTNAATGTIFNIRRTLVPLGG